LLINEGSLKENSQRNQMQTQLKKKVREVIRMIQMKKRIKIVKMRKALKMK
jgi:hypothetical protein